VKNALLHAAPTRVEVALRYRADALTLSITDDGRGFDPGRAPAAESGHFGLVGIRERAARLGSLQIDSQPERGTRLQVTVNAPYEET
jgi:signal transduction histidine kinase